jgi:hypothetical protein
MRRAPRLVSAERRLSRLALEALDEGRVLPRELGVEHLHDAGRAEVAVHDLVDRAHSARAEDAHDPIGHAQAHDDVVLCIRQRRHVQRAPPSFSATAAQSCLGRVEF